MAHYLFAWTLIILFYSGCALHGPFPAEDEITPAQLMDEGMKNLDKGRHKAAVRAFEKIRDRAPYSKFAAEAMLKMADAFYKSERYQEAFYAYNEFEMFHPRNPNVPYAIYRKGMCLFNEVSDVDRNQWRILKAMEEFKRLIRKFPGTEYTGRARSKIRECYTYLAEHELYVGHFYFEMKKYLAAMGRYRYVIENYPDLAPYREALEYLSKCKEILSGEQKGPGLTPREQKRIIALHKQEEINQAKTLKSVDDRPVINSYPETPVEEDIVSEQEKDNFPQGQEQFRGVAEQDDSIIAFHKGAEDGLPEADQGIERKKIFSVQVGAFLVKENAEKLVADLSRKGYGAYIFQTSGYRKRQWYSVRISDHTDLKEASNAASGFRSKEGSPAIVTKIDSLDPVTLKLE